MKTEATRDMIKLAARRLFAAHGVDGASVVTAMTFSGVEFAIRVSGLDDTWFRGSVRLRYDFRAARGTVQLKPGS